MAIRHIIKANEIKDNLSQAARELMNRYQVTVSKKNTNVITSISEALADLNDKRLDVGYTHNCAYILLSTSKGEQRDSIAVKDEFFLLHDVIVGDSGSDFRFVPLSEECLVMAYIDKEEVFHLSDAFNFFIDSARFGKIVETSLRVVRKAVLSDPECKIEIDPPDYTE